jgi:hypothetical protein
MDTRIFYLEMSDEATSLYMIMDRIVDWGGKITTEAIDPYWFGTKTQLFLAIEELISRGVIAQLSDSGRDHYRIRPVEAWRMHH